MWGREEPGCHELILAGASRQDGGGQSTVTASLLCIFEGHFSIIEMEEMGFFSGQ